MPFTNPIVAGSSLVRESIQSPNYATGVAGWSINRDGTAEFSDVVIRGTVEVGASNTDGHIYIGPSSNDPVLSSVTTSDTGMVMYALPNAGVADTVLGDVDGGYIATRTLSYDSGGFPSLAARAWQFFVEGVTGAVNVLVGTGVTEWRNNASTVVIANNQTIGGTLFVTGTARVNNGRRVVSSPSATSAGQVHWNLATVTTNAGGIGTITHGAGFTPTLAIVCQAGSASSATVVSQVIMSSLTSTTFQVRATTPAGNFTGTYDVLYLCTV